MNNVRIAYDRYPRRHARFGSQCRQPPRRTPNPLTKNPRTKICSRERVAQQPFLFGLTQRSTLSIFRVSKGWIQSLNNLGQRIWCNPSARARHPAPRPSQRWPIKVARRPARTAGSWSARPMGMSSAEGLVERGPELGLGPGDRGCWLEVGPSLGTGAGTKVEAGTGTWTGAGTKVGARTKTGAEVGPSIQRSIPI